MERGYLVRGLCLSTLHSEAKRDQVSDPVLQDSKVKIADDAKKTKTPKQVERRRLKQQKKRQTNRQKKKQNQQRQEPDSVRVPPTCHQLSPSDDGADFESNGQNFALVDLPVKFKSDVNFEIEGWPAVTFKDLEVEMTDDHLSSHEGDITSSDARKELFVHLFRNVVVSDFMLNSMFTILKIRNLKTENFETIGEAQDALVLKQIEYETLLEKCANVEKLKKVYHGWLKDKSNENKTLKKELEDYKQMFNDV